MPTSKNPILGKAWDLIALSITPMAKVRKPILRFHLFLYTRAKRLPLLDRYNSRFIREYEFSPSNNTPLFINKEKRKRKRKRNCLSVLICGGNGGELIADGGMEDEMEAVSILGDQAEPLDSEGDDDSVDRRAERFIQRFYEEMRVQRRRSL